MQFKGNAEIMEIGTFLQIYISQGKWKKFDQLILRTGTSKNKLISPAEKGSKSRWWNFCTRNGVAGKGDRCYAFFPGDKLSCGVSFHYCKNN
jgi:hypothetical protein